MPVGVCVKPSTRHALLLCYSVMPCAYCVLFIKNNEVNDGAFCVQAASFVCSAGTFCMTISRHRHCSHRLAQLARAPRRAADRCTWLQCRVPDHQSEKQKHIAIIVVVDIVPIHCHFRSRRPQAQPRPQAQQPLCCPQCDTHSRSWAQPFPQRKTRPLPSLLSCFCLIQLLARMSIVIWWWRWAFIQSTGCW